MPKRSLADQLDQAVQALLARPGAELPDIGAKLAPLLRIAQDLGELPRENFKATLRSDLERRFTMATLQHPEVLEKEGKKTAASPIAEGYHTITPYLVAQDAAALIDFVKQTFGAHETVRGIGSAGGIHCEVNVGESKLMIGGGGPGLSWRGDPWRAALHVYVPDADAVYQRGLDAGGISIRPPADQFYGERSASLKDQFGNFWYIATWKGEAHIPEGRHTVNSCLHPLRSEPVIDFLKSAFGAVEVEKHVSPAGGIQYAELKIGDSVVEFGDAHGPYQPMAAMFFVYVEDVDAAYHRALEAGAASEGEPADQAYGARTASVKDAFGNQWYLAMPIQASNP